jgi:hypothetical protein
VESRVKFGRIRSRRALIRMWWCTPDSLLKAKGYFLGRRDNFIRRLAILRSVSGLAIIAGIAFAYPEYSRSMPQILPDTANGVTGFVTASEAMPWT